MKILRWAAAAATALMGLMNLPFIVDDGDLGLAKPVAAMVSLLGLLGIVAAVALLRKTTWAAPAAVAVGGLNLCLSCVSLVKDWTGAPIGFTVSLVAFVLSAAVLLRERQPAAAVVG